MVSILARPEGRALHCRPQQRPDRQGVSILARPEGRALLDFSVYQPMTFPFQSSPAPKDGRYYNTPAGSIPVTPVSILARPEGRALPVPTAPLQSAYLVSILARPEGRALLHIGDDGIHQLCFNPRPPRRTGATGEPGDVLDLPRKVSILARPEGRALPA